MKKFLFLLVIMVVFTSCSDGSNNKADTFDDVPDMGEYVDKSPDETTDETIDETVDTSQDDEEVDETAYETADETIDETVDTRQDDEQVDETVDETSDEVTDKTTEEIPDEDIIEEEPEGMVLIPAGSFWMGSPDTELGRSSNEKLHYVRLTKGFYMDIAEVTQGSFNFLMGYNPSYFVSCGDDCPVESVSWHEALAYANERSKADSLEECFNCTGTSPNFECALKPEFAKPQDCKGYRLPTESEWEYSARAGSNTAFYNGEIIETTCNLDPNLDVIGWYGRNSVVIYEGAYNCNEWCGSSATCGPHPVGGKLANSFGLFDMSGNVSEWNWDWYGVYPAGTESNPDEDPSGPEIGSIRIDRGGEWYYEAIFCRSAYRDSYTPNNSAFNLGFRLVRTEK